LFSLLCYYYCCYFVAQLVSESERLRMKKLEELNKTIESLY